MSDRIKKHLQLLPLLLLTIYCADAIVASVQGTVDMAGVPYYYTITTKNYLAMTAVALNFVFYFAFRPYYKFVLLITIALGIFNFLVFPALETTVSYKLNGIKISFQPSAFFAGLLAYMINFKRVNNYILTNLSNKKSAKEIEDMQMNHFVNEVQGYKIKFDGYSTESLREITEANKLVPAAVEAARQLIRDRESAKTI